MNVTKSFLVGLIFLSSLSSFSSADQKRAHYNMHSMQKKGWRELCTRYFPPIIASMLIGAGTGGLARYIEKEFQLNQSPEFILWFIMTWYAEMVGRNALLASLQKDFDDCDIPYKPDSMYWGAWGASWIAYMRV